MPQTTVWIGVGSNLGEREKTIEQARQALSKTPSVSFKRSAPIYETEPVGGPPQGRYLNTVWEIETLLNADDLFRVLSEIESSLGRKRSEKNAHRTIDLDLLFFGDEVIHKPNLSVPHPRLQERWFVLKPLWDLRADLVHPIFQKSICELLDEVTQSHKKR